MKSKRISTFFVDSEFDNFAMLLIKYYWLGYEARMLKHRTKMNLRKILTKIVEGDVKNTKIIILIYPLKLFLLSRCDDLLFPKIFIPITSKPIPIAFPPRIS